MRGRATKGRQAAGRRKVGRRGRFGGELDRVSKSQVSLSPVQQKGEWAAVTGIPHEPQKLTCREGVRGGFESRLCLSAMIAHSDDYVEYCRETAVRSRHLHDLALRGRGKEEVTRLVHERIVREVELAAGDDLVDIGCGDGTLLRMATELGVRSALGLHATEQEADVVRSLGFFVKQALSHNLPVADASASVLA